MASRKHLAQIALKAALAGRGLRATPQALAALTESLLRSDPEYFGDSDTLLAGLLLTGSHTVDILEEAGVNRTKIEQLTLNTIVGGGKWEVGEDPLRWGFSDFSTGAKLLQLSAMNASKTITADDILRTALTPEAEPQPLPAGGFPFDLRKDASPAAPMLQTLEERLAEILIYTVSYISYHSNPVSMLRTRTLPISEDEDWLLDKALGINYRGMTTEELEFLIKAMNMWFVSRSLLTSPARLCLALVDRLSSLLFAPMHFARSGGDLSVVETGLSLAGRLAPARDLPLLALFLHEDRIHTGHFTYRDSMLVPDQSPFRTVDVQGVRLYSPRPVPLIPRHVLSDFETILSQEHVCETRILSFLKQHPEILMSLGYSGATPHVYLRHPDEKSTMPTFLLEIPGSDRVDILGLGDIHSNVVVKDPLARASNELARAIARLRQNARCFESSANRARFESVHGVTGFRPQLIMVFGTNSRLKSRADRALVESELDRIKLMTYDDLVAHARSRTIELPQTILDADQWNVSAVNTQRVKAHVKRSSTMTTNQKTHASTDNKNYDVALSFAGEDRAIAHALATLLKQGGIRVFYDNDERAVLWGKDLYAHLADIYSRRAHFCIIFISEHYVRKLWTNHERKAAQERAFREAQEYILPLRLDDTDVPGVLTTTGYLDLRQLTIEQVAAAVGDKLQERGV